MSAALKIYDRGQTFAVDSALVEPVCPASPERALLWAVIRRALMDLFNSGVTCPGDPYPGSLEKAKDSAWKWIFDEPEEEPRLRFEYCCEALEIDVGRFRRAVRQMYESGAVIDWASEGNSIHGIIEDL